MENLLHIQNIILYIHFWSRNLNMDEKLKMKFNQNKKWNNKIHAVKLRWNMGLLCCFKFYGRIFPTIMDFQLFFQCTQMLSNRFWTLVFPLCCEIILSHLKCFLFFRYLLSKQSKSFSLRLFPNFIENGFIWRDHLIHDRWFLILY